MKLSERVNFLFDSKVNLQVFEKVWENFRFEKFLSWSFWTEEITNVEKELEWIVDTMRFCRICGCGKSMRRKGGRRTASASSSSPTLLLLTLSLSRVFERERGREGTEPRVWTSLSSSWAGAGKERYQRLSNFERESRGRKSRENSLSSCEPSEKERREQGTLRGNALFKLLQVLDPSSLFSPFFYFFLLPSFLPFTSWV